MTMIEHLSAAEITAYVDGDAGPSDRARVATHLENCGECRDEVGGVVRLLRDAPLPPSLRQRPRKRLAIVAAVGTLLAASIATVILFDRTETRADQGAVRTTEPAINSEARANIATISPPDGASVSSQRILLAWHSAPAGLYRVTMTGSDGAALWNVQTADTTVVIPDSLELKAGQVYFWYVDAVADGIAASTAMQRLRIAH